MTGWARPPGSRRSGISTVGTPPSEPAPSDPAAEGYQIPSPDVPTAATGAFDDPAEVSDDTESAEATRRSRSFWRELPFLILIAVVVAVLIKAFLFQAFFIPSGSMRPSLEIDDRVLVSKLSYRFGEIARGDVVVFDRSTRDAENIVRKVFRNVAEAVGLSTPESDLIKRVIGLPGETITIEDGALFVDGVALDEPYVAEGSRMPDFGPETVPAEHYFVMGDNRNFSRDSRIDGPVHRDQVIGKAFIILWPPSRWTGL